MNPTAEHLGEPPWLKVARREMALGVREVEGPGSHPRILEYFAATRLTPSGDDTPWCSAFVNFCMLQAGITPTRKANARSWLEWGDVLKEPRVGAVVLWRGTSSTSGHVAFWLGETRERMMLLGGNQRDGVSLMAYPKTRLLGYRWPPSPVRAA